MGSGAKESTADPPPLLSARRLTRLEYALTEFVVHDGGREAITQPSQAEFRLDSCLDTPLRKARKTDGFRITSNHKGDYPIASARLLIGNEDFLISIFRIVPARHSHACRASLLIPSSEADDLAADALRSFGQQTITQPSHSFEFRFLDS